MEILIWYVGYVFIGVLTGIVYLFACGDPEVAWLGLLTVALLWPASMIVVFIVIAENFTDKKFQNPFYREKK